MGGREEKIRKKRELAKKRRRAVEAACSVPIVFRESAGVIDRECETPQRDSSDVSAWVDIGQAESLDLEKLENTKFETTEVSWFEVACLVLENYPPPLRDEDRVWVSRKGSLYHRYSDCRVMWDGKREANEEGMTVHPVDPMPLSKARVRRPAARGHGKLSACKMCIGDRVVDPERPTAAAGSDPTER